MQAADIHAHIGDGWPNILAGLGVPEQVLRNRHGPCPACGGKDCFRFDHEKRGRGSFICSKASGRQGGALSGDGFALLMHVHGWEFAEARRRVLEAAGLSGRDPAPKSPPRPSPVVTELIAGPTERIFRLRKSRCRVEDCDSAVTYLASRGLWPLPSGCALYAHALVDYFDSGQKIGAYPGLLADVVDVNGDLITSHVTWIPEGRKLASHDPRKILTPMTGRVGCAVRLMTCTDMLGIGEGIETMLSAAILEEIPCWAALTTSLLAKFEPPPTVTRLVIFADRDLPGLEAAARLMERLQGRVRLELKLPGGTAKDFNDVLIRKHHTEDPS